MEGASMTEAQGVIKVLVTFTLILFLESQHLSIGRTY
jgi:hypothetical protein